MKLELKEKKSCSCKKCGGMILVPNWWAYNDKGINIPTYFCKDCDKKKIKEINTKA